VTGRYRLLAGDSAAVKAAGFLYGERQALDALRLDAPFDDWPGLELADHASEREAYGLGIDLEAAGIPARASLCQAWIDGYRDGYGDAYYESETA
jgi:hypothetical protein